MENIPLFKLVVITDSINMTNKADKEKAARRRVLTNLVNRRNEHKIPYLLIWQTPWGTSFFGTDSMQQMVKTSFACQCICTCNAVNANLWPEVMDTDEREVIDNEDPFDPGMDLLNYVEIQTPIQPRATGV